MSPYLFRHRRRTPREIIAQTLPRYYTGPNTFLHILDANPLAAAIAFSHDPGAFGDVNPDLSDHAHKRAHQLITTAAQIIADDPRTRHPTRCHGLQLSHREIHCLIGASHGKTDREIAYRQPFAATLVKKILARAGHKLGATDVKDAINRARHLGLVPPVNDN